MNSNLYTESFLVTGIDKAVNNQHIVVETFTPEQACEKFVKTYKGGRVFSVFSSKNKITKNPTPKSFV